ncbi:hypothetical protein [Saccharolobus shibatae]|uniref:Uncharacterized protein n=1 Tax=Saccharolobus shibatae TaxID=2286 RepID=A0A8F5GWU3_9CREN|nr:hypothetical protein [Saccharolobus shibatae]QXJ32371.1 hypothetical protein J5U21_02022 [Saccharolobus shibatae]
MVQNSAKKLVFGLSWKDGTYRIEVSRVRSRSRGEKLVANLYLENVVFKVGNIVVLCKEKIHVDHVEGEPNLKYKGFKLVVKEFKNLVENLVLRVKLCREVGMNRINRLGGRFV